MENLHQGLVGKGAVIFVPLQLNMYSQDYLSTKSMSEGLRGFLTVGMVQSGSTSVLKLSQESLT